MKNTTAGARNSHSVAPFRRTRTGPSATRSPSSTSLSAIACAIHQIQLIQLRRALPVGSGRPYSRRGPRRLALLDFGLHRVLDLLHRDFRVGLLALEVSLPDRLADDKLMQPKKIVV